MTTTTSTWPAGRVLALIGLILYVVTGVFPYLASGLVAPLWGIAVLYAGWLVGLWVTIRALPPRFGMGPRDAGGRRRLLVADRDAR